MSCFFLFLLFDFSLIRLFVKRYSSSFFVDQTLKDLFAKLAFEFLDINIGRRFSITHTFIDFFLFKIRLLGFFWRRCIQISDRLLLILLLLSLHFPSKSIHSTFFSYSIIFLVIFIIKPLMLFLVLNGQICIFYDD